MRVDMTPYIALALALAPSARRMIDDLYDQRRGACHAAYMQSVRSAAIRKSRAEHQIVALRALGVLLVYGEDSPEKVKLLLRAANRTLFDTIAKCESVDVGAVVRQLDLTALPDDDFFNAVCLMYAMISFMDKPMTDDTLTEIISAYLSAEAAREKEIRTPTADEKRAARLFFKHFSVKNPDALYDSTTDEGRAEMDQVFYLANCAGIELAPYARDCELSSADLANALMDDPQGALTRALLLMAFKAVRKDRDFCLTLAERDQSAEIDALKAVNARITAERDAAQSRIAGLEAAAQEAERRAEKLSKALAEREYDAREIAALRAALYAAQTAGEEPTPASVERALPPGIVCIGGHETWARLMREACPEARFYPVGVTAPDSVIRAAEEVWFRADYIPHKDFYRVIDVARRHSIPVQYFSSANVARCAAELKAGK